MTSQGATRCGRKILYIHGFWSSEVCVMLFQACIELRVWKFNFNTEVRGCRYESTQSSKERLGVDMIEFTIITIQQVVMFSYSGKAWKKQIGFYCKPVTDGCINLELSVRILLLLLGLKSLNIKGNKDKENIFFFIIHRIWGKWVIQLTLWYCKFGVFMRSTMLDLWTLNVFVV
jgi:hypothetical protein